MRVKKAVDIDRYIDKYMGLFGALHLYKSPFTLLTDSLTEWNQSVTLRLITDSLTESSTLFCHQILFDVEVARDGGQASPRRVGRLQVRLRHVRQECGRNHIN